MGKKRSQEIVEPKDIVLKTPENTSIEQELDMDVNNDIILGEESQKTYDKIVGGQERGTSIAQASELFRLQGGNFTVAEGVDMNATLAANQGFGEQLTNVAKNALPTFAAGVLDNFNYDIPDMLGLVAGSEKEYGNWLSRITTSMRESGDAPIYQEGDSLADPTYWLKQAQNFSYTAGLVTGAFAEQLALSYATAQTGGATAPIQAAKLFSKGKLLKGALFGSWKGVHEGYINALETFEGTKNKYLQMGYSMKDSEKNASEAAALGYKMEVGPLMILNALQFGMVGRATPFKKGGGQLNLGFSGSAEAATDVIFGGIKNKNIRSGLGFLTQVSSEAGEEVIQTGVSKYAEHKQLTKTADTFNDFEFWDNEMRDSAIGGAFGGGVFAAMGKLKNLGSKSIESQLQGEAQDKFIRNMGTRVAKNLKEYNQAQQEGDQRKMDNLRFKMQRNNVFESLQLDYMNQNETSFASYVDSLTKAMEAVQKQDIDTLKSLGLTTQEDLEYAMETFPKLIQDAHSIKQKFTSAYEKTGDFAVASTIADSQQVFESSLEYEKRNVQEIEALELQDPLLQSLNGEQRKFVKLHAELAAIQERKEVTPDQKARYEAIQKELGEIDKEAWTEADADIIKSFDATELALLHYDNLELSAVKSEAAKRITEWSKPDKIKEVRKKRAANIIKKAKTVKELESVKETLAKEGVVDESLTELINDKVTQVKAAETVELEQRTEESVEGEVLFEIKGAGVISEERKGQTRELNDLANLAELEEAQNGNTEPLADETPHDDYFEPAEMNNLTESLKEKLGAKVKSYVESMAADKKSTSFTDFIKDFIQHTEKDTTDKIYNALVEGWKANNFPEVDFKQVYNDIFKDRKSTAFEILGLSEEGIGTSNNVVENKKENEEALNAAKALESPTVTLDQETNQSEVKDVSNLKTVTPTLKAAYLSLPFSDQWIQNEDGTTSLRKEDASNTLVNTTDVNSAKLLHPEDFGPKTKLDVRIPDNYKDMKVSVWEDAITKLPSMTFGQWMEKYNIKEGSPEWYEKVPMIAHDSTGEGVFFIHTVDWYNPVNLGLAHDPVAQGKIIQEGQAQLRNLRNKFKENKSVEIEIIEKRLGKLNKIKNDQPAITLNEANPQTRLGIGNKQGEIILEANERFEKDGRSLVNTKRDFKDGYVFEIRQVSKDKFIALKVLREPLNEITQSTLYNIISNYINQYNPNKANKTMRKNFLMTGLDMFSKDEIAPLVKHFAMVTYIKGDSKRILAHIKGRVFPDIKEGEAFMLFNGNAIVFGIKGQKLDGKEYIRLYPEEKKNSDKNYQIELEKNLQILKEKVLPKVKQNMSKDGLSNNRNMANIDANGLVTPDKPYREWLKDRYKTSIRSLNIGTQKKPVYATMIQPVITFKVAGETVDVANPSPAKVEEIKKKEEATEPLTKQESAIKQSAPEKFVKPANPELVATLKDTMKSFLEMGVPESDPDIQAIKEQLGELNETFDEPYPVTTGEIQKMKEEVGGTVPGLTIRQNFQVVDYIFNEISTALDFKYGAKIDKAEALAKVKKSYMEMIEPKQKKNTEVLENLKKLTASNPNLETFKNRMEKEIVVFKAVKDNWSMLEGFAMAKIRKFTGIKESTLEPQISIEEDQGLTIKSYTKSALEEGGKTTSSYRLKRFLAGVKRVDASGNVKTGFLGVPLYVGFDNAYAALESILSSPQAVESDFYAILTRLEENVGSHPWLSQVIEQIKTADPQIQNEMVYNFTRHTLSMKFVMFSKNRNGNYTLKVYDTNSTEITRVVRESWGNNFIASPNNLVFVEDGVHKINKERAKFLLKQFDTWKDKITAPKAGDKGRVDISDTELREWLEEFGITLSPETISEMRNKEITYLTKDGKKPMVFSTLFKKAENSYGIFGLLGNYLSNIVHLEDTTLDDNPQNHPFDNATNALKTISRIESKYTLNATTNSFRDGGKSIYGFTPTKYATDMVNRLKFDKEGRNAYRESLGEKSFSKHSFYLRLLNESENFRGKIYADHIGITALKELGKRVFGDNSITNLSNSDHELTKLGLFQDKEQGEIKEFFDKDKFLPLRMARMFFPTMSDKSQMLTLFTAVLNLADKHFDVESGSVTMGDQVKEALYSQMVLPELERITTFIAKHKAKGTDIKGYDLAAQLFLMVPELNNLKDDATGERVLSLMINQPNKYDKVWFEENMKEKAKIVITNVVESEVSGKLAEWNDSGLTSENDKGEVKSTFMNENYMQGFRGSSAEKVKMAAYDFVINSFIANANMNMTIAGDIAMYSQDKIAKYFQNGKPYLPKEQYGDTAYSSLVKDVISVNVGKRLALLLAPGSKIANSIGETYNQIFLNDQYAATTNLDYLSDLFEKRRLTDEEKQTIADFNDHLSLDKELPKKLKDAFSAIEKKFPKIAAYFSIEATDAQEYTTVKEHIDILFRQGRLHSEHHKEILAAIENGKSLNPEQLTLVLQPIKPVHTGFKDEKRFDVMRMMYIKTSSFPLIPQLTKGSEIDKVRLMLEKKEKDTGKSVRASYQSGNKVGGSSTPLALFNQDGTFNDKLTDLEVANATITLDRDNFRIQQDVPFKSLTKNKDQVSLGTQTLKLLFGDGMMDIDDFEYNGEKVTGKDLAQRFTNNFDNYTKLRKNMLFKELGMDKEGNPIDTEKTMGKLQDLLKREAEERGYPKQDIEALSLTMMTDLKNDKGFTVSLPIERVKKLRKGKLTTVEIEDLKKEVGEKAFKALEEGNYTAQDVQFTLPLWMSPNSNRYESLLNAIVTNRLVNVKLPGASYVLGSEGGFKFQTDLEGINKSNIIFLGNWEGQLKAAEYHEDGKTLKRTQVLLPSKFRDNDGKLINLLTDDYTYRDEDGVLRLKEGKIDLALLNIPSFRIPTSGHVSMSQVDIVGILPPEVGDLMIVPKNLSVQKGLDYDVDKETTYHLHTYTDDEGNIRPLDEAARQSLLKRAEDKDNDGDVDLLFDRLFGDVDYDLTQFEPGEKLDKVNDKLQAQIYENEFIKMHSSVLSNGNEEVQQKVNKVLSMQFAKGQAEMVQEKTEGSQDNTNFTMLSDSYQKKKMGLGASGKLGIGVYSNYVVFHSMVQQSDKPVQLMTRDEDGKQIPMKIQIGKQTSNGELGRADSLAPIGIQRSISEVFAERQNTATDNEKEQIMGRLNINSFTINVDSMLSALGFDKDMWEISKDEFEANEAGAYEKGGRYYRVGSLPYMILSQPIIKEYVEKMSKTQSNTQEFDKHAEEKILAELRGKYTPKVEYNEALVPSMLTGQELYSNLTTPNPAIQKAVLELFLNLDKYAKNASFLQSRLNINNSGLGKSFFETIEKYQGVQSLLNDLENNKKGFIISNASRLIGDYVKVDKGISQTTERELKNKGFKYNMYSQKFEGGTTNLSTGSQNDLLLNGFILEDEGRTFINQSNAELIEQGYVPFDQYLIKPTTPVGSMLINAVSTGYDLWNDFFPYDDANINGVTSEIMNEISDENASSTKILERQQHIFQEMKKFFVTSDRLGTFVGDPQKERARLFMDSEVDGVKSSSLANYLNTLMRSNKGVVYEILKSNDLLTRFNFEINRNGLPSLIKFDNTKGESFDEDYMYMALIELLESNEKLPDFNGESYSTKQLAQDLIAYNYLEGGIQQAVQFTKYIPVSYLNTIPFGSFLREWNDKLQPQIFKSILGRNGKGTTSRFARQYLQNNPQRLPKIDPERQITNPVYHGGKKNLEDMIEFEIDTETLSDAEVKALNKLKYVSIYNGEVQKGKKKFQVYEKDGDKFRRISTLGIFGMAEYSIKRDDVSSIVNDSYLHPDPPKASINQQKQSTNYDDPFFLKNGTAEETLEALSKFNFTQYPHLGPLVKALLPYISEVKIELADLVKDGVRVARGRYVGEENTVYIDKEYFAKGNKEDIAKTIVHEMVHALTSKYVSKYVNKQGQLLPGVTAPKEITNLMLLFAETRNKLGEEWEAYAEKRYRQLTGQITEGSTERERTVAYAGTNIHEFITLVLTEPAFQKEMGETKYRLSDDTLIERLAKIVKDILASILGDNYDPNTVTSEGVRTALSIVKAQYDTTKRLPSNAEIAFKENARDQKLAGEDNELLFTLEEPLENPTFVIPFKCK